MYSVLTTNHVVSQPCKKPERTQNLRIWPHFQILSLIKSRFVDLRFRIAILLCYLIVSLHAIENTKKSPFGLVLSRYPSLTASKNASRCSVPCFCIGRLKTEPRFVLHLDWQSLQRCTLYHVVSVLASLRKPRDDSGNSRVT